MRPFLHSGIRPDIRFIAGYPVKLLNDANFEWANLFENIFKIIGRISGQISIRYNPKEKECVKGWTDRKDIEKERSKEEKETRKGWTGWIKEGRKYMEKKTY